MAAEERPYEPPVLTRVLHNTTVGVVGALCRSFLFGLSRTEVHGLEHFQALVDERSDPQRRERGLITVSNHVSVLDDPIVWGVLPFRYHWDANNSRYSLGSHDICFKRGQSILTTFFTYGNTLPMHRIAHSKYGGIFQPTMTQVIRLLSDPHAASPTTVASSGNQHSEITHPSSLPPSDPFSASELTYTTNGTDSFPAPSFYPGRRHSWVHVFPEGKIHQHPDKIMRYFKWGVARMILESKPCPDVICMWIDGPQEVMANERTFPRPLPRPGKDVSITFGEKLDVEKIFGPFRERWRDLVLKAEGNQTQRKLSMKGNVSEDPNGASEDWNGEFGEVLNQELRYGAEAVQLRKEVTLALRNEVLKLRKSTGLPDEDPKGSLAETWREEGSKDKIEGKMKDGSVVEDM